MNRERVELEKSLALSLKLTQNEVKLSNSELEINLQKQELQFSKDSMLFAFQFAFFKTLKQNRNLPAGIRVSTTNSVVPQSN